MTVSSQTLEHKKFIPIYNILSKDDAEDTIINNLEKLYLINQRDESTETNTIYKNFDEQLSIYLEKISGPIRNVVQTLLDKKVIYIATNSKKQNNILGARLIIKDKISLIALDSSVLDIDILTGDINNIDEVVNQAYYQFIRCVVKINPDLQKNEKLNEYLINFYTYLLLKALKFPLLVDKKIELLKLAVGILYYKNFLKIDTLLAKEKALKLIKTEYQKEFDTLASESLFSKYKEIRDIIKAIIDLKISFDNANSLTYQWLNYTKVISFMAITTSYDHLVAASIIALYSQEYYKHLLINRQVQENIEKLLIPLYTKVKFDPLYTYRKFKAVRGTSE